MNREVFSSSSIFLIILITVIIIILYRNRKGQPSSCSVGEGFVYNNDDIGAFIGLGGYYCDICNPMGASYIDKKGYCKTCPRGQYYDGNKCTSCPEGQRLNEYTYMCECNERLGYHLTEEGCVKCGINQEYKNGQCVECTGGTVLLNNYCQCPRGSLLINGTCQNV